MMVIKVEKTSFFHLGHKVKPKKGKALIWANVDNNFEMTAHEALQNQGEK